jgi:hypothetical protein
MKRALPLLLSLLTACAPEAFVRPRLAVVNPAPSPKRSASGSWWTVLLHSHSVSNWAWLYDDEAEIVTQEKLDLEARQRGLEERLEVYSRRGVLDLLARAERRGADALVLTEHNTLLHADDPTLPSGSRTRLFRRGMEWTTRGAGHALLLGLKEPVRPRSSRRAGPADFTQMLAKARAQRAVVILNHPSTPFSPYKRGLPKGADAVEVVLGYPFDWGQSEALWHAALIRGLRLGAVAGADWHATSQGGLFPGGWRVTLVRAPELTEPGIFRAIAAGRTVAVEARRPGLRLEVTVDGRCREGDTCATEAGQPFVVRVEARRASGLTLEVFDEESPSPDAPAARIPVGSRRFSVTFRKSLAPGARGFVRAALRGLGEVALGSPVYLEVRAASEPRTPR